MWRRVCPPCARNRRGGGHALKQAQHGAHSRRWDRAPRPGECRSRCQVMKQAWIPASTRVPHQGLGAVHDDCLNTKRWIVRDQLFVLSIGSSTLLGRPLYGGKGANKSGSVDLRWNPAPVMNSFPQIPCGGPSARSPACSRNNYEVCRSGRARDFALHQRERAADCLGLS